MKKGLTAAALLLSCLLIALVPLLNPTEEKAEDGIPLVRVWVIDDTIGVTGWLKKRVAAFEKANRVRVYLRSATFDEATALDAVLPDVIVFPQSALSANSVPVCKMGYTLAVRDDTVLVATAAPTSALFTRPTPAPQTTAVPEEKPFDVAELSAVLLPLALAQSYPHPLVSDQVYADFVNGKAPAAVITAAQALKLPFGYRAYPVADGWTDLTYHATTPHDGELARMFVSYLLGEDAQRTLAAYGLFSVNPNWLIYQAEDVPHGVIERGQ